MIIIAAGLILFGGFCALLGLKLFRVMLPILGFISGIMVGFGGVQAVFGKNAVSFAIAIIVALVVGVLLAVLSYLFYELAIVILTAILGASVFTYLGTALGLGDNGFVLFLFGLSGAILGLSLATATPLSTSLVLAVTSLLGVGYILAGIMLLVGNLSIDMLQESGIINSVLASVDQPLLWIFVWFGAAAVAMNVQIQSLKYSQFEGLEYDPNQTTERL
jgi:hypothetical protein